MLTQRPPSEGVKLGLVWDGDSGRVILEVLLGGGRHDDLLELIPVDVFLLHQHRRHVVQHADVALHQILGTAVRALNQQLHLYACQAVSYTHLTLPTKA